MQKFFSSVRNKTGESWVEKKGRKEGASLGRFLSFSFLGPGQRCSGEPEHARPGKIEPRGLINRFLSNFGLLGT